MKKYINAELTLTMLEDVACDVLGLSQEAGAGNLGEAATKPTGDIVPDIDWP